MNEVHSSQFAPIAIVSGFFRNVRWPVLAICTLYVYLAFHALSGSQGVVNWVNNDTRAEILQSRLDNLTLQKQVLEAKVEALSVEQLDIDVLDQLSREKLFYSYPKELTIWLDPEG
ncbi:hypothetical protein [Litorimonas taeanensis]|nr:hypothetical protein [Litorimonas taeanensis]